MSVLIVIYTVWRLGMSPLLRLALYCVHHRYNILYCTLPNKPCTNSKVGISHVVFSWSWFAFAAAEVAEATEATTEIAASNSSTEQEQCLYITYTSSSTEQEQCLHIIYSSSPTEQEQCLHITYTSIVNASIAPAVCPHYFTITSSQISGTNTAPRYHSLH